MAVEANSKPSAVPATRVIEIDSMWLTPIAIIIAAFIVAVPISLSIFFGLRGASFGTPVSAAECDSASPLSKNCLVGYAQEAGLNSGQFEQCLASEKYDSTIAEEISYGSEIGIQGTPSLFIGENKGDRLYGFSIGAGASAADIKEVSAKIDSEGVSKAMDFWKQKQEASLTSYEQQVRDYYAQQGQTGDALAATVKQAVDQQKTTLAADLKLRDVSYGKAETDGSTSAKSALMIFSDFECPYCKSYAQGVGKQVGSELVDNGKLLFVLHDFPLESIHPNARRAANAARCAAEQGKFMEYHDLLFQVQN